MALINLRDLTYRLVVVTPDGTQIDVTDITTALGWSEGEKELATKIQFKLAASARYKNRSVIDLVRQFTPCIIYADMGAGAVEITRGTVQKWEIEESNGDFYLDIEAADEAQALRQSEDNFYFSPDSSSSAIISEILNKWGVPHEIQIKDAKHDKKTYRKKKLCDMVQDVLKDLKEKDGGIYFLRAKDGVLQIIPRGTNEVMYHFDIDDNLVKVKESFDASKMVTRVLVVGKKAEEGRQKVESTVDGRTEYGTRQVIYQRGDKVTSGEAETAAKKILDEQGDVKRKTTLDSPDVPTLRKGDRIRVGSSLGESYFFVSSIRHSAPEMRMTLDLDYDKEYSESHGAPQYNLASTDESESSDPN